MTKRQANTMRDPTLYLQYTFYCIFITVPLFCFTFSVLSHYASTASGATQGYLSLHVVRVQLRM